MESAESATQDPISLADVRLIVRFLGRIAGADASLVARKRLLMRGLSKLIRADGWFWSLTSYSPGQIRPVLIWMIHGGVSDNLISSFVESMHGNQPAPEDAPIQREVKPWRHFTRTRQQLIPDEEWYSNPVIQERLKLGYDHYIYSIYPMTLRQSRVLSFVGFFRKVGRVSFSDRDRRIVHIVTSEIDWLHQAGVPEERSVTIPQMPPRQRMVLILLLEGHDRKTIARLLRIRPNTAKEHIEAVYAHYKVSSQVELICRFSRGDGHDLA